jgi:hypothetical protein
MQVPDNNGLQPDARSAPAAEAERWVRIPGTLTNADHLPVPAGDGSGGSLHRHQRRWESLLRPFAANSYPGLHRAQIIGADALSP